MDNEHRWYLLIKWYTTYWTISICLIYGSILTSILQIILSFLYIFLYQHQHCASFEMSLIKQRGEYYHRINTWGDTVQSLCPFYLKYGPQVNSISITLEHIKIITCMWTRSPGDWITIKTQEPLVWSMQWPSLCFPLLIGPTLCSHFGWSC